MNGLPARHRHEWERIIKSRKQREKGNIRREGYENTQSNPGIITPIRRVGENYVVRPGRESRAIIIISRIEMHYLL